jgi:hypothetical protein
MSALEELPADHLDDDCIEIACRRRCSLGGSKSHEGAYQRTKRAAARRRRAAISVAALVVAALVIGKRRPDVLQVIHATAKVRHTRTPATSQLNTRSQTAASLLARWVADAIRSFRAMRLTNSVAQRE